MTKELITNRLIENGFTGYDSQFEEFIIAKYEFEKTFSETKSLFDKNPNDNLKDNGNFKHFGISFAISIIGIIIWRLAK